MVLAFYVLGVICKKDDLVERTDLGIHYYNAMFSSLTRTSYFLQVSSYVFLTPELRHVTPLHRMPTLYI